MCCGRNYHELRDLSLIDMIRFRFWNLRIPFEYPLMGNGDLFSPIGLESIDSNSTSGQGRFQFRFRAGSIPIPIPTENLVVD